MYECRNINYLSDAEIIDFVKRYIDRSSYNYAILIDGSWGCGKTFFIKEVLKPEIEKSEKEKFEKNKKYKQRNILYVSLYGVATKDEIARRIFMDTIPFKKFFNNKYVKIASGFGKTIFGGATSFFRVNLPKNVFKVEDFTDLDNSIVIFDDLERCNMNINETLGYINSFIEHDGIKAIIVANENEISSSSRIANKELKYLVTLNNNLEFPQGNSGESIFSNTNNQQMQNNSPQKIKANKLKEQCNILFNEDELYKQIKEKLIGVTIHYKPDILSVIDIIVQKNIINKDLKKIVIDNKAFIAEKFDYFKHQNVRTLLFSIDKFIILSEYLMNEIKNEDLNGILGDIFKYILVISIRNKIGLPIQPWKSDNEIDLVTIDENIININNYIKGFKFVDQFISQSCLPKVTVIDVIKKYIEAEKKQKDEPNDPLFKLNSGLLYMEDNDAKQLLKEVNRKLSEDQTYYDSTCFSSIIFLNIWLKRAGILSEDIEEIIEIMKRNLNALVIADISDALGWTSSEFDNDDDRKQFIDYMNKLRLHLKKIQEDSKVDTLNSIFSNSDWIQELSLIVGNSNGEFTEQKAFMSKIQMEKLLGAIKISSNSQILKFYNILTLSVYGSSNINEFYQDDRESISEFIVQLL